MRRGTTDLQVPEILFGEQDTFYVGTLKGVGRVYQQTVIDTYSKVGFAKLNTRKTPPTAADILNDQVILFFDEHETRVDRILTDRGTEYCGAHDRHEYELYLAVEDTDHTRTKVKSLLTNGTAGGSTRPCSTSLTAWRSARRSTTRRTPCRSTSMSG